MRLFVGLFVYLFLGKITHLNQAVDPGTVSTFFSIVRYGLFQHFYSFPLNSWILMNKNQACLWSVVQCHMGWQSTITATLHDASTGKYLMLHQHLLLFMTYHSGNITELWKHPSSITSSSFSLSSLLLSLLFLSLAPFSYPCVNTAGLSLPCIIPVHTSALWSVGVSVLSCHAFTSSKSSFICCTVSPLLSFVLLCVNIFYFIKLDISLGKWLRTDSHNVFFLSK